MASEYAITFAEVRDNPPSWLTRTVLNAYCESRDVCLDSLATVSELLQGLETSLGSMADDRVIDFRKFVPAKERKKKKKKGVVSSVSIGDSSMSSSNVNGGEALKPCLEGLLKAKGEPRDMADVWEATVKILVAFMEQQGDRLRQYQNDMWEVVMKRMEELQTRQMESQKLLVEQVRLVTEVVTQLVARESKQMTVVPPTQATLLEYGSVKLKDAKSLMSVGQSTEGPLDQVGVVTAMSGDQKEIESEMARDQNESDVKADRGHESSVMEQSKRTPGEKSITCYRCGRLNHVARKCRVNVDELADMPQSQKRGRYGRHDWKQNDHSRRQTDGNHGHTNWSQVRNGKAQMDAEEVQVNKGRSDRKIGIDSNDKAKPSMDRNTPRKNGKFGNAPRKVGKVRFVRGTVNGQQVRFMINCGQRTSWLSTKIARKLDLLRHMKSSRTGWYGQKGRLAIDGEIEVDLCIGDIRENHVFLVVSQLNCPAVLGQDFLDDESGEKLALCMRLSRDCEAGTTEKEERVKDIACTSVSRERARARGDEQNAKEAKYREWKHNDVVWAKPEGDVYWPGWVCRIDERDGYPIEVPESYVCVWILDQSDCRCVSVHPRYVLPFEQHKAMGNLNVQGMEAAIEGACKLIRDGQGNAT